MNTTIRARIMEHLVSTVFDVDGIAGVVDDVPWDYVQLPAPTPGYGSPVYPFAFVYELDDVPRYSAIGSPDEAGPGLYRCDLTVQVEVAFRYYPTDPAGGLRATGRRLLGSLQAALMFDPTRGRLAHGTAERSNVIDETGEHGYGVAVWQGVIEYSRSIWNPFSREATRTP